MIKIMHHHVFALVLFVTAACAFPMITSRAPAESPRPQAPCDIYGEAGTPCVAAHSTVRALVAAYNGPLYQVKRLSDGKMLDIGLVRPSKSDAGRYADAAAQDAFCAETLCVIEKIYDQSGRGNDLLQAAPGTFRGPAKGGFDTQPIADMAPVTIGGHKAYGVFIMPGMGFRNNNASGIAINDEAEGIYYVVDGTHFDSGCCFDYGNSSTNGKAVGTGTMETTYFGTSTSWGKGVGRGPWIMSDMEAGLFSGHGSKENAGDPTIDTWRFVTAVMDGASGNHWNLRGGNAQAGALTTFYDGERPASQRFGGYAPMRKQGGILLGTGGDNGNGSSGTFYEGVMTAGFPSEATTDAVQANVVAAHYDVARLSLSHLAAFSLGSTQEVTATFRNTTNAPIDHLRLSVALPGKQWIALSESKSASQSFAAPVAPGASVTAAFRITAPSAIDTGFLTAKADWRNATDRSESDLVSTRVRSVPQVKINEVRFGTADNAANQFIEIYNASSNAVDLSRWSLISTPSQWSPVTLATVPAGTSIPPHGFYLLGLANSGLAAPTLAGDTTIYLRNIAGLGPGQTIQIDGETRTLQSVGTEATPMSMIFIPVSTGPRLAFPAGTTNLPVFSTAGFTSGQKVAIDLGGHYEIATITNVGKAATQTTLTTSAPAGATRIQLAAAADVSAGDTLTISTGARKELAKAASVNGSVIELSAPLRLEHAAGVDVSDTGTGITFTPGTRLAHASADSVQALGSGIALDHALSRPHDYGAEVRSADNAAGYTGGTAPNQWFGSMLSPSAGSLALMDATGHVVVDAIVYGSQQSNSSANGTIASPELATLEGDQGAGGCIVAITRPEGGQGFSVGRSPDGADTQSNCKDFHVQSVATLAAAASAGSTNIKVSNVDGFTAEQRVTVDSGDNAETAMIASVGTPGATTTTSAAAEQTTTLAVANALLFRPGVTITIGEGSSQETAVVAGGRRGAQSITVESPLKFAHPSGSLVAGSGITFTTGLVHNHRSGAAIADRLPTPGTPNDYAH